jgi:hypothetical protein
MQRVLQNVKPDKVQQFLQWEKAWQVVNDRLGGPPKRYYRAAMGTDDVYTIIWEREFESLAVLEAYSEKVSQDPRPELKALGFEAYDVVAWHRNELYQIYEIA